VSFPWEEDNTKVHDTSMSNADKRRLEEKAKQLEQMMNQNERKG
jgi:hypothetical protein